MVYLHFSGVLKNSYLKTDTCPLNSDSLLTFMRVGTSRGPFLDLPTDVETRANVLLKIMGSPDKKQIDGLGGAVFVTSKVVMVRPSERAGIDVDLCITLNVKFISTNLVIVKNSMRLKISVISRLVDRCRWRSNL